MSGKGLFEGMSYVDERFVDEAETKTLPKSSVGPWIKVASMAACLCLILFSLYNLQFYLNRGATEGDGQEAADVIPEGGLENELEQDSRESNIVSSEDRPTEEVPSVILYVEEMTDIGFTATVAELVDTDIFEIGMELNVVITDGTRHETADDKPSMSAESKTDYSGTYVMVQFIEYNKDTGTIVVNLIREAEPPEETP